MEELPLDMIVDHYRRTRAVAAHRSDSRLRRQLDRLERHRAASDDRSVATVNALRDELAARAGNT